MGKRLLARLCLLLSTLAFASFAMAGKHEAAAHQEGDCPQCEFAQTLRRRIVDSLDAPTEAISLTASFLSAEPDAVQLDHGPSDPIFGLPTEPTPPPTPLVIPQEPSRQFPDRLPIEGRYAAASPRGPPLR